MSAAWVAAQWRGGYIEYMGVDLGAMRDRQAMVWLGRRSIALHGAATQWSGDGAVLEYYLRTGRAGFNWVTLPPFDFGDPANRTMWAAAGFGYRRRTDAGPGLHREGVTLEVPYWFLVLLTLSAPAAGTVRAGRRRRRLSRGLCPRCGYDLRASPDRCPECGYTCVPAAD